MPRYTQVDGLAPSSVYYEWLEEYLSHDGRAHYTDIVNTSAFSATSMVATRFSCWTVHSDYTGQDEVVIMDAVVDVCKNDAGVLLGDAFPFSNLFLFLEGLKVGVFFLS